ncbi:MAG TPA: hypothetical protein ENJ62_03975, partial [Bryobacterales bacterium]|nr:hypothetical protein [Bryobacterales bacterium]
MRPAWDRDDLKGLLLEHVEKAVLGLAVILVGLVLYLGLTREGVDPTLTPDRLQQESEAARRQIHATKWEDIKNQPERNPRGDFDIRVRESQQAASSTPYVITLPWNPPLGKPGLKRTDPELLPPEQLEVAAAVGPLAVVGAPSPLASLEAAKASSDEAKPNKEEQQDRAPQAGRRGGGKGRGGKGGRGRPGAGEGDEGSEQLGALGGLGGLGGKGRGGPGAASGFGGPGRVEGAEKRVPAEVVGGYRPANSGSGDEIGVRTGYVIAVKAVVPVRKQKKLYDQAFADAVGYVPSRDRYEILLVQLERADVTEDPDRELQDKDFTLVAAGKASYFQIPAANKKNAWINPREGSGAWHGTPPELVDSRYVDPAGTFPCPPLMIRPLEPLMKHSRTPRGTGQPQPTASAPSGGPAPGQGRRPRNRAGGGGKGAAMSSMFGLSGDNDGQDNASNPSGGMPGRSGMPPGMGPMSGRMGAGMPGMPGMPGMSGTGGAPAQPGAAGGQPNTPPDDVEYRLIRVYDLTPQPGRKYRYRIRLFVRDPNSLVPVGQEFAAPERKHLAQSVIERLEKAEAEAAKSGGPVPYYRTTAWSSVSPVIGLPETNRVATGPADRILFSRGGSAAVFGARPELQAVRWERHGPSATGRAVGVVWSDRFRTDVAWEFPVRRGTVLNIVRNEIELLDPVSLVVKQYPKPPEDTSKTRRRRGRRNEAPEAPPEPVPVETDMIV